MIRRSTILVLGAGASAPFGYPTGQKLLMGICSDLRDPAHSSLGLQLRALGYEDKEMENFGSELACSEVFSVDAFLECRPEYKKIGKLAMTIELVSYEIYAKLFPRIEGNESPSWYQHLLNKMVDTKLDDFVNNDLGIITFNYDRSLEFYWFEALKNRFGSKHETRIKEILAQMRIVHVYGRLGGVPWENGEISEYAPNARSPQKIKELSEQIIVMSEQEKTSDLFVKAQNWLKGGTYIYFLGFGYHLMNLERLELNRLKDRKLYGSSYGLKKSELDELHNNWMIETFEPDLDILNLFRVHRPL